ncbi:V-snare-domain-containing protein [Meredithblackwellia eburnea MCA 4105]
METIRRDLHSTTASISSLLTTYAKLAAQASTSYSSSGVLKEDVGRRKEELEGDINAALDTFEGLIERLANLHATAHPPPSASATHALERHREVYSEYQREYQRTKANLREAEARANLLGSVREEISAFKSSNHSSATDALLSERNHIDNSHRMLDDIMGTAHDTRATFAQQRSNIQGINARMNGVIAQVPALNSLLGMINSRRNRDAIIMGCLIGVCTLALLYFIFG